jgi:hypothetical protein
MVSELAAGIYPGMRQNAAKALHCSQLAMAQALSFSVKPGT